MSSSCEGSASNHYTLDSLFGMWEYEDSTQRIRLIIEIDNKVFFTHFSEPSEDNTCDYKSYGKYESKVFHTSMLNEDSLIMTDCNNKSLSAIIREYNDSTIVLDNLMEKNKRICFKRLSRYDKISDWFKPEDSLDYILPAILSECIFKDYYKDIKGYQLSIDQMKEVLKLMQKCADRDSVSFECNVDKLYPLNWYIRQYASYTNQDNHIIVRVSLTLNSKSSWSGYNDEIIEPNSCGYLMSFAVCDGGNCYAEATIDLTTKKVLYFYTHGIA